MGLVGEIILGAELDGVEYGNGNLLTTEVKMMSCIRRRTHANQSTPMM